jgi:hypothetical protein
MKIYTLKPFILITFLTFCVFHVHAQTIRTVGGTGANYSTLKLAFDAINSGAIKGTIQLQITGNTTESSSAVLNASGSKQASYTSILIYPTVTGVTITGSVNTYFVELDGADNVTFDGRLNATGTTRDLTITNTHTGTAATTFRFVNSAENNTLKYLNIKGSATNGSRGIIFFSISKKGYGNVGNVIDNNNITNNAGERPVNAIYSLGTSGRNNSGNTISNNNIYDVWRTNSNSYSIQLGAYTSACTITGNSFYETTNFIPAGAYTYSAIGIFNTSGINFNIERNYIGGAEAQCGGSAFAVSAGTSHMFQGIYLNVGTTTATSVQENTIANMSYSSTNTSPWSGLYINGGAVNVGTIAGNAIGATTGTGSINITGRSNNTNVYGIYIQSGGTVNCRKNSIGSVSTENTNTTYATNFYGIYKTAASGTTTINSNIIGSPSTANSLQAVSTSTATNQIIMGIYSAGTGAVSVSNNTVANIKNECLYSSSSFSTVGIATYGGANTISGNSLHDISCSYFLTVGILQQSKINGFNQTITKNSIYNLSNTHPSSIGGVYAIYYDGPTTGTNTINGNFIHSLNISSANTSCSMDGIVLVSGVVACTNNIINIGNNNANPFSIYGIWDDGASGQSNSIYYNTIYISGTTTGTTSNTFAYSKKNNSGITNLRNNIFVNARSGGSSGKHYAIGLPGIANLTVNYNDYFVSGTGGVLGRISTSDKNDLGAWKSSTGQDDSSLDIDPVFATPGGTDAIDYYIAADLPAITEESITTDYSGLTRTGTPTMGALETNDFIWTGASSTDFATAANWQNGVVPLDGADILFAVNPSRDCILDQDRVVGSITNAQATDKLVLNGKKITINGSLILTNGAQIDATSALSEIVYSGLAAQSISSGSFVNSTLNSLTVNNSFGVQLIGSLTVTQKLALATGDFSLGANTLTLNGAIETTTGALIGGSTANIHFGGSVASTFLPAVSLGNLIINRSDGISLGGDVTVAGTLALTAGTLIVGANTLSISGSSPSRTTGAINAGNADARLVFANASAISLPASIFNAGVNNLVLSGKGGVTSSGDFEVVGILDLQVENPSATKGILDMWDGSVPRTLTMGAVATTIGAADVTGIIKRTTILPNVLYTFGNQFVSAFFPNEGTLPTEMSIKVKIGSELSWRTGAILRETEIIQTGGNATKAVSVSHYQDSELNGNVEENLVFWSKYFDYEYGRSAYNTSENWVSLSNINVAFFSSSWDGSKTITLDEGSNTSTLTWNGSVSDSWTSVENWTPNVGPSSDKNIVIPDAETTLYSPLLPLFTEIKTITVNQGGVLNAGPSSQLTVNGSNGAWFSEGTFNASTSNVTFTNANATMADPTDFYNVTIADEASLTLGINNVMRIAGTLSLEGNAVLHASSFPNTVEFNGTNQTIINPNGNNPGYFNIILSGNGSKTLPATTLSILGDFILKDTATASSGSAITFGGNLIIEEHAAFNTGNYSHTLGGNFDNNGSFTSATGYEFTMNGTIAQWIGGTVTTDFTNLTISNSAGVTLSEDINIENELKLTNGNLNAGIFTLGINGTIGKTSGFIDVNSLSSLIFGGSNAITLPSNLFFTNPSLNNLTINRSGGVTFGNQDLTVNGTLELTSGTLNIADKTLKITGGSPVRTSGNINAGNIAATVIFTNSAPIILPASIFTGNINHLTVNGTGGLTSTGDMAINGVLNLQSENPSAFKGGLDMWDGSVMKTLTMGANATTIGPGDVTGIIKRTFITAGVTYSFGNQYMTAFFPEDGTLPTELSVKLAIGTTPSWRPGGIKREAEIIQTGGSGTKATFSFHYLESELNGNDEEKLVFWIGLSPNNYEYGRSANNTSENWISLSNINVAFYSSSWDATKNTTLDEYSTTSTLTWNGSVSDSWTSVENWTPNAGPSLDKNIIIPDASTTPNSPVLPAVTEIKSLTIDAAGVLNSAANSELTVNGGSSAWNNVGGTFNPNTSTVIFTNSDATITGSTNFYNLTTNTGKALWMISGSTLKISGTLTNNGILHTFISGPTTVEYNGADQTIVVPNFATNRYSTLLISGTGNKTLPITALKILGDFITSGSATAIAGAALTIEGDVNIGSGTTFNTGDFSHTLAGNLVNNGSVTASSSGTTTFAGVNTQTISGTGITGFNNLSIDNTSTGGVLLTNDVTAAALSIASDKRLTINTQAKLDVTGSIVNNAGVSGIIIKSSPTDANGSLIFHNNYESPVQATVEMYTKASRPANSYKWQFFGIPIRTMPASPILNGSFVREMRENDTPAHWFQLNQSGVPSSYINLNSFTGYQITQVSPKTIYFKGALENKNFESGQLSYSIGKSYPGQHLIGNPYTAAIDISKIVFGSDQESIIENTVYMYNCGSYDDWTSAGSGSASDAYGTLAGQYTSVPIFLAGSELGIPGQIPSMQAFLVRVNSDNAAATVSIPYSTTGTLVKNTYLQRAPKAEKVFTRIDVKGVFYADRMWIFTNESCTRGFDNGWDGRKFFGSTLAPQVFAMEADGNYQINAVDDINNTDIGFKAGADEEYTFTFTHNNIETLYPALYLLDLHENKTVDITQNGTEYSFLASSAPVSRFKIVTQPGLSTESLLIPSKSLKIYSSHKTIFIDNKSDSQGELMIYDITGRMIQKMFFKSNVITKVPLDLAAGLYLVKGKNTEEEVALTVLLR